MISLKLKTILLYLFLFSIYLVAAYYSRGVYHYDEHFQIIEFARYKIGDLSSDRLPWEFIDKIRPWISPFLFYLNLQFCKFFKIDSPESISFIFRAIHAVFGVYVILHLSKTLNSFFPFLKNLFLNRICFALSFFFPMLLTRGSSENESALFFWLGFSFFVKSISLKKESIFLLIGILWGLAFQTRYQIGFMIFGVGIWYLIFQKLNFKVILNLTIGFFLMQILGIIIDFWGYGNWQFTPYKYFYSNLIENRSSLFGTLPFFGYFDLFYYEFYGEIGSFIILVMICFCIFNPKHILTFIIVPFTLIHFYIPHKELRFLFPIFYVFTPIFFFLIKQIFEFLIIDTRKYLVWIFYSFTFLNILILPYFVFYSPERNFDVIYFMRKNYSEEKIIYYDFFNPLLAKNIENFRIPFFDLEKPKVKRMDILELAKEKERFVYIEFFPFIYTPEFISSYGFCNLKFETPIHTREKNLKKTFIWLFNYFKLSGFRVYECNENANTH